MCLVKLMVVDYIYYTDSFSGKLISREWFDYYSKKAAAFVSMITFGRSENNLSDEVKSAVCATAEVYFSEDSGGAKTGETVGDYSVSYSKSEPEPLCKKLRGAALPYLIKAGLMNRCC